MGQALTANMNGRAEAEPFKRVCATALNRKQDFQEANKRWKEDEKKIDC
jgi:hypothetical protein